MEAFLQGLRALSAFDYVCLTVLMLSAAVGAWRGLVSELIAILGWLVAFFAAWQFWPLGAALLSGIISNTFWQQIGGAALLFVLALILASLLRVALKQFLRLLGLRGLDRMLGMLFGLVRGVLLVLIFVLFGGLTQLSAQPWWQQGATSDFLEQVVLDFRPWMPDEVAREIHFG